MLRDSTNITYSKKNELTATYIVWFSQCKLLISRKLIKMTKRYACNYPRGRDSEPLRGGGGAGVR